MPLLLVKPKYVFLNILDINVCSSGIDIRKKCGDVSNFPALSYFVHNSDLSTLDRVSQQELANSPLPLIFHQNRPYVREALPLVIIQELDPGWE